jgi:NAD(P)-dependent dehydrogenase (short-subunit alcohol dehydrogenase family)
MDLGLKNCRAFVAGASRGFELACAEAQADEGTRMFICSRNTEELKQAADAIAHPYQRQSLGRGAGQMQMRFEPFVSTRRPGDEDQPAGIPCSKRLGRRTLLN